MSQTRVQAPPVVPGEVMWGRGDVVIPFEWLRTPEKIEGRLLGQIQRLGEMVFGNSCEYPPFDCLTAWTTMAHLGQIEQGGICLEPQLDREERLKLAATMLDPGELVRIETIAVPRHVRQMTLEQLVAVIYTEDNFYDAFWAACWMILVGFHLHPDYPFDEGDSDKFPGGEMNCRLFCTFGEAVGVTELDDELGWTRLHRSYTGDLIGVARTICRWHYKYNGPPPYEHMADTVPRQPGWRSIELVLPDRPYSL
jgi:hypothetical protein